MSFKKSQMEMMGLALIVIIISIAMIFVIKFVVLEKPAEYKKGYAQEELASKFVLALFKTQSGCVDNMDFTELFQNVAEGGPYITCSGGEGSADAYLPEVLDSIFEDTFGKWRIPYEFNAFTNPGNPLGTSIYGGLPKKNDELGGCPGDRESATFTLPINAAGNTLYLQLDVC